MNVNIFAQQYINNDTYWTYNNFPYYTTPSSTYCNINVRNFAILLIILIAAGLTAPFIYVIIICKDKCCRKKNDKVVIAPIAP